MKKQNIDTLTGRKGQSLVELALFLPIFLIIIAGVVEVSQLVITQNRITDAARASSRFGVNGGQDDDMVSVIRGAITDTLGWDESKWDIWVIHGKLDEAGTSFLPGTWEFTHEFGYSNTVRSADLDIAQIQAKIIDELQLDHTGNSSTDNIAGDLEIVGTYIIHDIESMLGFDSIPALASINSVSELNVMRLASTSAQNTIGCSAFPIAVSAGIRSVTPSGTTEGNPFPNADDFEYPLLPPNYESFQVFHTDNASLEEATEGTIFKVSRGFNYSDGNFGWLKWNLGIIDIESSGLGATAVLSNSLAWPGDSTDYFDHNDDGAGVADGYDHVVRGFVQPGDTTTQALRKEGWVSGSSAQLPEVSEAVNALIDSGTGLRVIVFNTAESGSAQFPDGRYFIKQFDIFRILGYGNSAGDEWLLLQYIRPDNSCGEPLETP